MIAKLVAAVLLVVSFASVCLAKDLPVTDNLIIDEVRIKLSGDAEVKGGALEVDCKQGIVTISGTVETDRQKSKATKLAKKVKGVKQVVNNITVKKHG